MGIQGDDALFWATGIDTSGLASGTRRGKQLLSGLTNHAQSEADKLDAIYRRLGAAIGAYLSITAGKDFVNDIVRVRGEFQQLEVALNTMLGSKREADKMMNDIIQMSIKTPFTLMDVAQNTKQLMAMGIASEKVMDTIKSLGDVAAGVAVPLQRIAINYGQVATLGKLQTREVRDFAMAGIPLVDELAKMLEKSKAEIQDMVTAGEIGFPLVEQAFKNMSSEGGKFANLMEKQMGTVTGRISNLKDAFDRMLNTIGQDNEGAIIDVINILKLAVENYEDIVNVLKVVIATYGTYKGALIAVSVAQKASLLAEQVGQYLKMARALGMATANQIAFNRSVLVNPYLAIAGAIAAIVGSLTLFNIKSKEHISISQDFQDSLKKEVEGIKKVFGAAKDAASGSDKRKKAIDDINEKYKEYLPNLLSEKSGLDEIKKAQDAVTESLAKSIALKSQDAELEETRRKTSKIAENYSSAASDFTIEFGLDNESKGKFFLEIDELVDTFTSKAKYTREQVSVELKKIYDDFGIIIKSQGNFGKSGVNREFISSLNDYIAAKRNEVKVTKDLEEVYTSYLKQLGLINDEEDKKNNSKNTEPQYSATEYEDFLKEKLKLYKKYENEKLQLGKEFADKNNKELLKDGNNAEDFLNKQLVKYSNNLSAKSLIAQEASKEDIKLSIPDLKKILPIGVGTINDIYEINPKTLKSVESYKKTNEQNAKLFERIANLKKLKDMGEGFIEIGYGMQDLANFASNFNEELGLVVQSIGDISGSFGNIMSGIAEGGVQGGVQIASGIIGIANTLYNLYDNSEQKQQIALNKANALLDIIKLQNYELERQIKITKELSGESKVQSERETLKLIQKQMKTLDNMARKSKAIFERDDVEIKFDVDGNVDVLEDKLANLYKFTKDARPMYSDAASVLAQGFEFKNLEDLLNIVNEYNDLLEQRRSLISEMIGSTEDSLSDSLIGGLENGLSMIDTFANTFEDAMKQAILSSFESAYILPIAKKMIDGIYNAIEKARYDSEDQYANGYSGRIIKGYEGIKGTYDELLKQYVEEFKNSMQDELNSAKDGMETMNKLLSELGLSDLFSSEEANGLADTIQRSITEETGSVLAGLFNTMSIDVRNIYIFMQDNAANQASRMQKSISILTEIEVNTRETAENTKDLEEIKSLLKDIRDNSEASTNSTTR